MDTYAGFTVEMLALKGLARTRLAKSFADGALGETLRLLRYKAEWAGREWRELPRFQRSTGICQCCGATGPRLPLSVREWACETCGAVPAANASRFGETATLQRLGSSGTAQ